MREQVECVTDSSIFNMLCVKPGLRGRLTCISLSSMSRKKCKDSKIPTLLLYLNLSLYIVLQEKVEGCLMHKNKN